MLSKNKNNKISRHQTNLRKKLQKLQRQSNQTYHATFAFTILALIILTALVAYISFQIGYTMGGFKAGAYEHSNSLQSFDQHSNVEETPSQKTGDYDDLGAPAQFIVTGYNTLEAQTDSSPCISASGDNICGRDDVCACPPKYPFKTRFLINGKEYTCLDRTGSQAPNHIDISFDKDLASAKQWGVKKLDVKIIK
jgi:3D (Asp-Asp-Asp) domain-containing protein